MRVAQRYLLLSVTALILVPCALFLTKEAGDRMEEQYEKMYLERFVSDICRTGRLTYEEYYLFHHALSQNGNRIEITISEYQREQDLEGNNYYVPIVWKEIQAVLYENKQCYFAENSIVKVTVKRWEMKTEGQIQRFGRVNKGVVNDTQNLGRGF